jgi:hypothetical protein
MAMQPATYIAIVALVISFGTLVVSIVSAVKNYKRSNRDAFTQRRDHLFQKISDLNAKNTEAHLISARYEIVAVKNAGLPLRGEQAERNTALIVSFKEQAQNLNKGIKNWDENIEKLHSIYISLTSETDAAQVEKLIALVQVASDNLKKSNDSFLSSLHILETTSEIIETKLAESDEKIRQINLDFERGMKNLGF